MKTEKIAEARLSAGLSTEPITLAGEFASHDNEIVVAGITISVMPVDGGRYAASFAPLSNASGATTAGYYGVSASRASAVDHASIALGRQLVSLACGGTRAGARGSALARENAELRARLAALEALLAQQQSPTARARKR